MKNKHPYVKYENTALWSVVKKAVDELIINQDIELTTKEEYVVGLLCKRIENQYCRNSVNSDKQQTKS